MASTVCFNVASVASTLELVVFGNTIGIPGASARVGPGKIARKQPAWANAIKSLAKPATSLVRVSGRFGKSGDGA